MSLINDMLKNLDRRQQRRDIAADLQPAPGTPQKRKATPATVIAAALLVGLAAFAIERMWPRATPETEIVTAEVSVLELPEADPGSSGETTAESAPLFEPVPEPEMQSPAEERIAEADSEPEPETESESESEPVFEVVTEPEPEPEPVPESEPIVAAEEQETAEPAPETEPVQRTLRTTTPRERAEEAYTTAVRHLSAGRRAQAEDALTGALGHDGAHHEARSALVNLLLGAGRVREAEHMLQEGLRISPTHAPFADQYARILMRRGDLAAALGILESAAPAIEDEPDYHALVAYLQQQAENHEAAAALYRELVAIRPAQGNWWLGLGMSLEALDNPIQALDAYRRARSDARLGSEVLRFINERIRVLDTGDGTDD